MARVRLCQTGCMRGRHCQLAHHVLPGENRWRQILVEQLPGERHRVTVCVQAPFSSSYSGEGVDFLWSRGGNIVLLEARWTEHPQRADTSALEAVNAVFAKARTAAYRISEALVVCRTLDAFVLAPGIRVVNGFHLQEVVVGL